ncbi:NADH-quinone oxidoreductase subunit NuoG [Nocardioides sp. Kera G14]|uniref:NADH-quinone oxidoreductase subunit NuoG n=1 Tax=Nocardioides sp. Kera G14 TaxID=2884264 RepID=UPI001D10AF8E|nr:NADH-quinone oxidoreductase subunit NuoG [Nocardioides sp. Kera G14]UDY23908.1 NADH-quinone oxidoreductase subunit NuoG [Nocardioides sp. Kera G14]
MTTAPVTTVTLTIDGRQVTVPEGTLLIRAAEQLGIEIPRFCDHALLAPAGACRQCLVNISDAGNGRGFPKPQASCTIPVADGMVVETVDPVSTKARAGVMEFLLINHPLDCPVCDKGGECPLQNQAMSAGGVESRFAVSGGVKRTYPKPIPLSPNILLDRERCVLCQRCTRFAEEIPGDPGIALVERGARQQIGIADGVPFSSYFSGNVIQICPVGALTSTEYRFRGRPFDLVSIHGVGEHDACGAAIRTDVRRGKVLRRQADEDTLVNEEWISDKDRFAFRYLDDRITTPLVRDAHTGELREAAWTEAFALAAQGLSGRTAGLLPGGRLTLEDARAWADFARTLGADVDFRSRPVSDEETSFLREHVVGRGLEVTYNDLTTAPVVVLAGLEPEDEAGTIFLWLRKAVTLGHTKVITIAPFTSPGSAKLQAELIRTKPGDEAAALAALEIPDGAIVLAGERLAQSPGALTALTALTQTARWAWVPRRAGDRGAVEAGLLPADGGRNTDAILAAAASGEIEALIVGGVQLRDLADPAVARASIEKAGFVISLEQRLSEVSELADVVFPVAPVTEKSGTFLNWEGRARSFDAALNTHALSDARVLDGIAHELGVGSEDPARPRVGTSAGPASAGAADVGRHGFPGAGGVLADEVQARGRFHLATWKLMLDNGIMQRGDKDLAATARSAVARLSAASAARLGASVTITGDRGAITLPAEVADLDDDVVWVPANSFGNGVLADLASPGSTVEVTA